MADLGADATLFDQLREIGVSGSDAALEDLLLDAGFDVNRAANLYLDRRRPRPPPGQAGLPPGAAAAAAAEAAERYAGDRSPAGNALRSRDRRRARRHGGLEAVAAVGDRAAEGGRRSHAAESRPGLDDPGGHGRPAADGHHGGQRARVRTAAVRENNTGRLLVHVEVGGETTLEIDPHALSLLDVQTGEVREVRRYKPGCWRSKASPCVDGGWAPLPREVSQELERARPLAAGRKKQQRPAAEVPPPEPSNAKAAAPPGELKDMVQLEQELGVGEMGPELLGQALAAALREASRGPRAALAAAEFVDRLASRRGLRCSAGDARQAGLIIGSMALLKAVLSSNISLQLVGLEVFDQKYPGMKLNERGRKDGIRSLLARGMTLGAHAPSSKLLHKVEADSVPLWESRCLDAMLQAHPALPETTVFRVKAFLA